ncbi:hypothetical protein [Streptomyces sp. NPDC004788]
MNGEPEETRRTGDRRKHWTTVLARAAVARLAPDELALFEETAAAYFARPAAGRTARAGTGAPRTEPLGMGIEMAVDLVTGAALAVSAEVAHQLCTDAGRAVAERTRPWLSRLRRRPAPPAEEPAEPLPELDPAALARIHALALTRARTLGLPDDRAALLADAIVGALTVRPPSEEPSPARPDATGTPPSPDEGGTPPSPAPAEGGDDPGAPGTTEDPGAGEGCAS